MHDCPILYDTFGVILPLPESAPKGLGQGQTVPLVDRLALRRLCPPDLLIDGPGPGSGGISLPCPSK